MTFAGGATAATPQPVSAPELSKATTAAKSPTALRLLGKLATTSSAKTAKATGKLTVAPDTHGVYALNPAFVRDASAPVATFWYAANTATTGDQSLTVFTAPDPTTGTWQPVNVASGNTEARMTTAARGALVFTEPQIGAWSRPHRQPDPPAQSLRHQVHRHRPHDRRRRRTPSRPRLGRSPPPQEASSRSLTRALRSPTSPSVRRTGWRPKLSAGSEVLTTE